MRWWFALACTACGFQHGIAPGDARTDGDGAAIDAVDAAVIDVPPACASPFVWTADFAADPTQQNSNGDGFPDWRMRDGGALAGTLAGGIWQVPGSPIDPLDTQPKHDFTTRTRIFVRMRNTANAGSNGAVFWINVDYNTTTFAPIYVDLRVDQGQAMQTATVYGKDATSTVALATFTGLSTGMQDIALDLDPAANGGIATVAGVSSSFSYTPILRNGNDDRFATVVAYGSDAEFDDARIEVCP